VGVVAVAACWLAAGAAGAEAVTRAAAAAASGPPSTSAADPTQWHLDSAFGRHGVAGLPLKEEASETLYGAGPGDEGLLTALGPQESLFVGGYAQSKPGTFLLAHLSARGTLVKGFGSGGVTVVPAIHSTPQTPPRLFALAGGKVLIVGLDRSGHLTVVRVSARGGADRDFGRDGVARYKLSATHGATVITAATVEADGDILAVYQSEAPQPKDEPAIPAGLGQGAIHLVRLLPSGALDSSFGKGGFLTATGRTPELGGYPGNEQGWACALSIAPEGSLLLAYEQSFGPSKPGEGVPAVQQLDPAGADAPSFGEKGAVYLPSAPGDSLLCDGLFALPGGGVAAGFGGEGRDQRGVQLYRFSPTGTLETAFGESGHVKLAERVSALALDAEGEAFSIGVAGSELVLGGTLPSGASDPSLGGAAGMRFAAGLSHAERDTVEALPSVGGLSVRVGDELVRLSR
jgi:hypothetical protein